MAIRSSVWRSVALFANTTPGTSVVRACSFTVGTWKCDARPGDGVEFVRAFIFE